MHAVAKAVDQLPRNVRVPYASIAWAGRGGEDARSVLTQQHANLFSLAVELQAIVQGVSGNRGREGAQIAGRRLRQRRQLAEREVSGRIAVAVGAEHFEPFVHVI